MNQGSYNWNRVKPKSSSVSDIWDLLMVFWAPKGLGNPISLALTSATHAGCLVGSAGPIRYQLLPMMVTPCA